MKIFGILFSLVLFFLVISNGAMVMAQNNIPTISPVSDLTLTGITTIFGNIANWILGIVAIIAVVILIYAGFLFMTAGGEEDKLASAKNYLKYGLIGLGIAILAFSGVTLVQSILLH